MAITSKTVVAVGALGGTIAMTTNTDDEGAIPTQGVESQTGDLAEKYGISTRTRDIALVGSPSMTIPTLLDALDFARHEVDDGACGVVLTHGSDTMAEAAFFLSLLWDREEPLIFTGAMRPSDVAGSDGPGNLAGAIRCAAESSLRGLGTLIYFADHVHSATLCEKTDSTWVNAFTSPGWGPLARVDAESVTKVLTPAFHFPPLPAPDRNVQVRIPVITATLDDDGCAIEAFATQGTPQVEAIVIAGAGAGRLSECAAKSAKRLASQGTVVAFVRKPVHGVTTTGSYAYPGSESDLIEGGLIPGGLLSPEKTRILLHVLIQAGYHGESLAHELRRRCLA
ncbi:MAG: asparaginase [Bifidobacterium psychraerophilum]|uniref:asparaginase n=1 Tax=Bifidobacterium psychraerophilum TaxID=218140 RepID=UPI0039EC907F